MTASQQFGSNLYMGTDNSAGAEIWRTDGSTWTQVVSAGFGNATASYISQFAVFSGQIYAVIADDNTGAIQIYRSSSGDAGSWTQVSFNSSGITWGDVTFAVYDGYLYLGLARGPAGGPYIAELWRSNDGSTWSPVFTNGLGDQNNSNVSSMADFGGTLFIGLRNLVAGGQVWKSTDGTNFNNVFTNGLGNSNDGRPYGMYAFNGNLYLIITNTATGDEVWRTSDGSNWAQVGFGGWGDANTTYSDYYDKGAAVFNNSLFIGTGNWENGGKIWKTGPNISGNAGVAGATLSYTDGTAKKATSGSDGSYSFFVSPNWTGTVTPSLAGYTFSPTSQSYTNVTSNQTQNYTAIMPPVAVFRPSNGKWYINGVGATQYGTNGDIPVPADYAGAGHAQLAVFRPSNGKWYINGVSTPTQYGTNGDIPVPADYTGIGHAQLAVFRPSNGKWYINGVSTPTQYGTNGDIPVPADYTGVGYSQLAVFRPSNGKWYINGVGVFAFGTNGDIPVPADYNKDGKVEIRGLPSKQWQVVHLRRQRYSIWHQR